MTTLKAPFPYEGGKARAAAEVWQRFGQVDVYAEPFFGSGAVLLGAPRIAKREVVCDTNGHIVNFWRAMAADPAAVARAADWPSFHDDLYARHQALIAWGAEHAALLREDARWYDAERAGWGAWGKSNWINGGWCLAGNDKRPYVRDHGGGRGVQPPDWMPYAPEHAGGRGVNVHGDPPDWMPYAPKDGGGRGVNVHRAQSDWMPSVSPTAGGGRELQVEGGQAGAIGSGDRLQEWFRALQQRLARVVVLNRDWTSAVTNTVLCQTPSAPPLEAAVFLDPPYRTDGGRVAKLYESDLSGDSTDVAVAAYQWAVANGERLRIAYCCAAGDFPVPDGWTTSERSFGKGREGTSDQIMFSPTCYGQQSLL